MTLAPLLVTGDPDLITESHRLAAAAGCALDVVGHSDDARSRWGQAPVVLVGADAVDRVAQAPPPRRDLVVVVARSAPPDSLFRGALALGAETVVELPAGETWLVETLTDTADGAVREAPVVAVVGGTGGAGASVFAAALAASAASDSRPVTLVDADPLGPGLDLLAGLDPVEGARWASLMESAGRLGSRSLRAALPARGGLAVLTWGAGPRATLDVGVVREVLSAARRGSVLVVVDLPRHLGEVPAEMLSRTDDLVVVAASHLPAVAASLRLVEQVSGAVSRTHLVVRGSDGLLPEQVAQTLGLPLVAAMRDQRRLAEVVDLGLGPVHFRRGPLARAARTVLREVLG